MPRVIGLSRAPKRGWPMEELLEVAAVQEVGFRAAHVARREENGKSCWLIGRRWTRWSSVQE
jgi:hypothetical protein